MAADWSNLMLEIDTQNEALSRRNSTTALNSKDCGKNGCCGGQCCCLAEVHESYMVPWCMPCVDVCHGKHSLSLTSYAHMKVTGFLPYAIGPHPASLAQTCACS